MREEKLREKLRKEKLREKLREGDRIFGCIGEFFAGL